LNKDEEGKYNLLAFTQEKRHTSMLSRDTAAENALESRKSPANTASRDASWHYNGSLGRPKKLIK
jgi:hypothetical protein